MKVERYRLRQFIVTALLVGAILWALSWSDLFRDFGTSGTARDESASRVVEDLYDAEFVSAGTGWVVGAFGAVYRTDDGGRSWVLQETPTTQHLYSVAFADRERGWAVGRSGEILHTGNGGEDWTRQESGVGKHLFHVTFPGTDTGWAIGDWGVLLHTRDGGRHWEDHSLEEDRILNGIAFADARHGWIVGEFGTVLHTRDGGETWQSQNAGTGKTLFGIAATSADEAWIVGIDGLVLRTEDAGETWQVQRGVPETRGFAGMAFRDVFEHPGLYDIAFANGQGFIVGDVGTILRSDDDGRSWATVDLPDQWRLLWLRGLDLDPSGDGIVVGARGLTVPVAGGSLRFGDESL